MSKAIPATCQASIVTASGSPVPSATILSEGIAPSEGVLILDGEEAVYLANTAEDLKTAIDTLSQRLTDIATILTALDAVTVSPGTNAASIAALIVNINLFALTKDLLK